MFKSKFCKFIKINNEIYAVFNSLLMEPIFLSKNMAKKIKYNDLNAIPNKVKVELKESGIIVDDKNKDKYVYNYLKNNINQEIAKKISIMYLIPNSNCNLACKYCFIGKLNNQNPTKMTIETMKNAVDKYYEYSKKQDFPCKIIFYGGEPLISFENIKIITQYIKEKKYNFQMSIVTNGTLLNDEIICFLKNNNFSVGMSIDGPKILNDKNRIYYKSSESVYDNIINNIDILNKNNVDYGLSITLSKDILNNQDIFLEWLNKLNVKSFSYNMLHFTKKTNEWKKYYAKVTNFLIKSNNIMFEKGYSEDRVRRKYSAFYDRDFKYSDCAAKGGNQITIKPNGDIIICHGQWNNNENLISNINNTKNIEDIFKSRRYNEWYNNIPLNNKKCKNCKAIYVCGGGCAMQSKDLFGNEKRIDKAFCIHTKKMLKYIMSELYYEDIKK